MNKFEYVRRVLPAPPPNTNTKPSLLDVGCRDCELKDWVGDAFEYSGVDMVQNTAGTVQYVVDVARGLPLPGRSRDVVVALDLVEHVDDMEGTLKELLRVSRQCFVVMLPNMAFITHRLRFLFTGRLGEKYDMRNGSGSDRHRWVTTQSQSDAYMEAFALAHGLAIRKQWFVDSKKKRLFAALCRGLGVSPNVWVWASLYVLSAR